MGLILYNNCDNNDTFAEKLRATLKWARLWKFKAKQVQALFDIWVDIATDRYNTITELEEQIELYKSQLNIASASLKTLANIDTYNFNDYDCDTAILISQDALDKLNILNDFTKKGTNEKA